MNRLALDELAHIVANNDLSKNDTEYLMVEIFDRCNKLFMKSVNSFFLNRDYNREYFDEDDLRSAYATAVMRAVKGFDMDKGTFLARVNTFSTQEYINLARKVMAGKRFGGTSTEQYEENLSMCHVETIPNSSDYIKPLIELVREFISNDKEGEVIRIYITYSSQKERKRELERFFGKYEERERKRVQRVRERLAKFLARYKQN